MINLNKHNKKIVYITTNASWSGSEELWTRSAKDFLKKGYSIAFASKYIHEELSEINAKHYIFDERFTKSLLKKVIGKIFFITFKRHDIINELLKKEKPELVIISQGNNIDYDGIMECCYNLEIPYITITNLVTEVHFLSINSDNLYTLQQGYLRALKNFFVSKKNLNLNNTMLAIRPSNTEVIFSPSIIKGEIPSYPKVENVYKIALIGRIECFHKGYDLLLELAQVKKWQERPIHFNVYGDGPHVELLNQNICRLGIGNITLKGYAKSISVWKEDHILFMPSRMEGMALTLIEAMYCNRAAIVTDVGDAAVLIEDNINGFVADSATVKSLDDALERAWNKKETWKDLGINAALTLKEKYSENAIDFFNKKVLSELYK